MIGSLTRVVAQPGKMQELIDFLTWDGVVCREQEPGTLRFEFYPDPSDPQALFLYEAYQDEAAFQVHAAHEPYRLWVAGVQQELTVSMQSIFGDSTVLFALDQRTHAVCGPRGGLF